MSSVPVDGNYNRIKRGDVIRLKMKARDQARDQAKRARGWSPADWKPIKAQVAKIRTVPPETIWAFLRSKTRSWAFLCGQPLPTQTRQQRRT